MEFSFDRSKDAQLRKPETTAQQQPPQPQAQAQAQAPSPSGVRPGPDLNTVDPSTIANERLRKAIERNRAKQAARSGERSGDAPTPPPQNESTGQASFFSQAAQETMAHAKAEPQQAERSESQPPPRPEMPREVPREVPRTTVVSRRSVAKPEDTEFVPVKRTTRKVASQISYTTSSTRKKSKQVDPKYLGYLVKGCWIFCAVMVLRLIFAAGGVTDYYSQKNSVNERLTELSGIKKENMQLVREIERMRSDTGFQKKLVRDNLGFIAADEFLVLFPKD